MAGIITGAAYGPLHAPPKPNPSTGQVYALDRHGTVYLTRAEHVQQRLGMLLFLGTFGVAVVAVGLSQCDRAASTWRDMATCSPLVTLRSSGAPSW